MVKLERKSYSLIWGAFMLLIGVILEFFKIGGLIFEFGSVGKYLIYVGFIGLIIGVFKLKRKEKKIDEREYQIALKSNRYTYVILMMSAFFVIIYDGIKPITMPYHLFLSYAVIYSLLVTIVIYYAMLRYN